MSGRFVNFRKYVKNNTFDFEYEEKNISDYGENYPTKKVLCTNYDGNKSHDLRDSQ